MSDALDKAITDAPEDTGSITPHGDGEFSYDQVLQTIQEGSKRISLESQPVSLIVEKIEVKQKPGKSPCAHLSTVVSGAKFPVNEKGKDIIGVKEMFFVTLDSSNFSSAIGIQKIEDLWHKNGHKDGLYPRYEKLLNMELKDVMVDYRTPKDDPEGRPFASIRMAKEDEK